MEGPGWFELITGFAAGLGGFLAERYSDVEVRDHAALFGSMIDISIGLMAVSAIVVTLSAALSPRTVRLTQSVGKLATASFAAISALLVSAVIGLFLLAFDPFLLPALRYGLTGSWAGLVAAASIRSLSLGRRILLVTLRDRAP